MIYSGEKSSLDISSETKENLTTQKNLRSPGKYGKNCTSPTDALIRNGHPQCSTIPYISAKNYFGLGYEDPQFRLKLLQLTPRNQAKETSEGVQKFIRHVSSFIEKKNPFKDSILESVVVPEEKNLELISSLTLTVSENPEDTLELTPKTEPTTLEQDSETNMVKNLKDFIQKPKPDQKQSSLDFSKKDLVKSPECKKRRVLPMATKNKSKSDTTPREQMRKTRVDVIGDNEVKSQKSSKDSVKSQKINNSGKNSCVTSNASKKSLTSREKSMETPKNKSQIRQSQNRNGRPSEIPLRKNRLDISKKKQPVSGCMKKQSEKEESPVAVDANQEKEASTPVEDISSKVQNDEEKIKTFDIENSIEIEEVKSDDIVEEEMIIFETENLEDLEISKCLNASIAEFSCSDSQDQRSGSGSRSRKLDLEKVKSSSFTVLSTRSKTLYRLESLHQQNVYSKENAFYDKGIGLKSSKLKIILPKSSFNALKGKGSKKNLSARLSSKGNKPALKNKTKQVRKEHERNLALPKGGLPSLRRTEENLNVYKQIRSREKNRTAGVKNGNLKDEGCRGRINAEMKSKELGNEERKFLESSELDSKVLVKRIKAIKDKVECQITNFTCPGILEFLNTESLSISTWSNEETPQTLPECQQNEEDENIIRVPKTPPPSPEDEFKNERRSETVTVKTTKGIQRSSKTFVVSNSNGKNKKENSPGIKKESTIKPNKKTEKFRPRQKYSLKYTKLEDLVLKGIPLKFDRVESEESLEASESDKVKLEIKIDVNTQDDATNSEVFDTEFDYMERNIPVFDWLLDNYECDEDPSQSKENLNDADAKDKTLEEARKKDKDSIHYDSISDEVVEGDRKEKEADSMFKENYRSFSSLKKRQKNKLESRNLAKRRKLRSKVRNGWIFHSAPRFNSAISFKNKMYKLRPENKLRSGLTKSHNREVKVDDKKDMAAIKLRRRNSEPHSFRGFIWKRTDMVAPKGNRASVSSLASSLRHLNTDELEDFVFWEAVPQKMTSCWEMSLYNFKRPWSVLSCSVFKDNRESNTPGLILQNLRNSGTHNTRRSVMCDSENQTRPRENPFDVEPSIAQKNIDIRNWLAALNFPTLPSSSVDVITEGNFTNQSTNQNQSLSKSQASLRHRKVLPGLKFSEEGVDRKIDDRRRFKESKKWNPDEVGNLMELIRKKSGGFVTTEQYLHSEMSSQNVTVNHCKSIKDERSDGRKMKDEILKSCTFEKLEISTKSCLEKVEKVSVMNLEHVEIEECAVEAPPATPDKERNPQVVSDKLFAIIPSDINIWKYLFISTLFIITIYFLFLQDNGCRA